MIFAILFIFCGASHALAHRIVLFAYVEGNTVFTESYFSDGKKCRNSRIEVFDKSGGKLLEGKTDENGEFSFEPPKKMDLRIVLTASMGHKDEYIIPAAELQGEAEGKPPGAESHKAAEKAFQPEKGSSARQLTPREVEQIRMVVEEALDKKLKPIRTHLLEQKNEGVSFIQVMGGIGFILGIMGIILYFKSRRGR
jgi:nickel transport protein